MTPERWGRIKVVFHGALELSESERRDYVDAVCHSDEALKQEVLRLLNEHQTQRTEQPAHDLTGMSVSHYDIFEKIGEGGMAVVYKAQDRRLDRAVALKFIRSDTIGNDLNARFLHEARAAAALDHPNVCTVYEVGEADGCPFLAMAWVDGESLCERIREGPRPLDEVLRIGTQIAEGLHAAHEAGIVHRDIKSANIMVTKKGQVKIMDFGVALRIWDTRLTRAGTVMGTPAFMSPEQVRGEELDHRTDIWSCGVVLYEMVTGRLPFRANTPHSVALAIQNEEPEPVTNVRAGVPVELDFVLAKALAKDRTERYQNVSEFIIDLRRLSKRVALGGHVPPKRRGASMLSRRVSRQWLLLSAAALGTCTLSALLSMYFLKPTRAEHGPPLRRFAFRTPALLRGDWSGRDVAISPGGKHVAMAAVNGKLWVEDLETGQSKALEGTDGAEGPFWSPDSQSIGFAAGGELMKIRVEGGTLTRVCPLPRTRFHGGTWSPDGRLMVFASSDELYEVPADGGSARMLQLPAGSVDRKYYPSFLPMTRGARVLLFAGGTGKLSLYVYRFDTGELTLLEEGCKPSWSSSGHILYQPTEFVHELWALPFSLTTLKPIGKGFVIARDALEASVSDDGTLAHRAPSDITDGRLAWVDRRGRELESVTLRGVQNLHSGSPSPDARSVAYHGRASTGSEIDIWIYDALRGTNLRLTSDQGRDINPVWAPGGEYISFSSNRTGPFRIYLRRVDGSNGTQALTESGNNFPTDWSRDGKYIVFEETARDRFGDIWFLERGAAGSWQAKPYLQTEHGERFARVSPDGRFVAYLSNETGREELYVRPFPVGSRRWTVSSGGAALVFSWRNDGRELFYISRGILLAVPVSTDPDFSMGTPTPLFPSDGDGTATRDGRRFLIGISENRLLEPTVRVVQNWYAEFRERR